MPSDPTQTTDRLADFARECGVQITSCGLEWGGRFGYKTVSAPNVEIRGYRTERAARLGWLQDEFGSHVGQVVRRRLRL